MNRPQARDRKRLELKKQNLNSHKIMSEANPAFLSSGIPHASLPASNPETLVAREITGPPVNHCDSCTPHIRCNLNFPSGNLNNIYGTADAQDYTSGPGLHNMSANVSTDIQPYSQSHTSSFQPVGAMSIGVYSCSLRFYHLAGGSLAMTLCRMRVLTEKKKQKKSKKGNFLR